MLWSRMRERAVSGLSCRFEIIETNKMMNSGSERGVVSSSMIFFLFF